MKLIYQSSRAWQRSTAPRKTGSLLICRLASANHAAPKVPTQRLDLAISLGQMFPEEIMAIIVLVTLGDGRL